MDGFSPAKNGISELFSSGRTGLTPSGPIGKTPVGGYGIPGGLSPLHAHYKAQMAQNPGVAVPMSDELSEVLNTHGALISSRSRVFG